MAITAADVKLLESERMRDTSDGGGRQTANVIPSGVLNNVFPKISRVDAVYGRVNLRKIFSAVDTPNLDIYAGAHAIITDPPDNPRVSCVLFSTGSAFDVRSAARNRIESYVVAGPKSRMRLYGRQITGQRAITTYQRVGEPLPDVGDVYVLSVEGAGYTPAEQYVRITDVAHEVRTFTENFGALIEFDRRVLTLTLSTPLQQDFVGAEPTQIADPSPTVVRSTQVADASEYFGILPLAVAATAGDLEVRLASVYAALVPSTQRETPVSLAEIAGTQPVIASGAAQTDTALAVLVNKALVVYCLGGCAPGSLTVSNTTPTVICTDDGAGNLLAGAWSGFVSGTVDYKTGAVRIVTNTTASTLLVTLAYKPAGASATPGHTKAIAVTLATRGSVYAETLNPLPAPGSATVDFRSLDKWYRLRDDGNGQLVADDPAVGVGSVDYATGATIVTLSALPDVDSSILLAWGSPVHYTARSGASSNADAKLGTSFTLAQVPVAPGSASLSFPVGGANRTATDAAGVITGTGVTGTINYATGAVRLLFDTPPDRAGSISANYSVKTGSGLVSTGSPPLTGGQFTVPGTPPFLRSGSIQLVCNPPAGWTRPAITVGTEIKADGSIKTSAGQDNELKWAAGQTVGTFDETTGIVTISSDVTVTYNEWITAAWVAQTAAFPVASVFGMDVERDAATGSSPIVGEAFTMASIGLDFDLTSSISDPVVEGSVLFVAGGAQYIDRNGTLYADVDPANGAGTPAGSVSYSTGRCALTYWRDNVAVNLAVQGLLTQFGDWTAVGATFRTAGAPIRPASFYVQVAAADGALLTATSDTNGNVSGPSIAGTINHSTGIANLQFGADPGGGWVDRQVMPSTLRYNAVVLSDLPLDPAILGLDPVRLPANGLVPIVRPGNVAVMHHTATTTLPNPVAASGVYPVGRVDLAVLELLDASGAAVAADRYTVDLALGEVTMASDWIAGLPEPLVARHRVEDMLLVSDVQISGDVAFAAQLTHSYPLGSYLSTALLFGDVQALVTNVFDQQTWTSVWSDTLIGNQATAQYNDIAFPIEVLNDGAVTERWRINFTGTTAYQVIGENLGVIATGVTNADTAPVNPLTGKAYFVIRAGGWGASWATGNQLRFNTLGASAPIWIARTVLAGASLAGDAFALEARGDVD